MEILKHKTMKNTKIKNMRNYAIVMMSLLVVLLSSCDKRELCMKVHPHDALICNTNITFTIDPAYTNQDETLTEFTTDEDLYSGDYVMRYTAEFWSVDESGNLETLYQRIQLEGEAYTGDLIEYTGNVMLPALDMKVMIWADPIDPTGAVDPAFDVESLQAVTMTTVGGTTAKDGFTLTKDLYFEQYAYEIDGIDVSLDLELERAFGRHRIIATDLAAYLEKNEEIPAYIDLDYQFYVATQYNCYLEMLQSAQASQGYTFTPVALSEKYLLIGEDYLFISPTGSSSSFSYYVVPTAYDAEDEAVNLMNTITIPNTVNTTELVYGTFLTSESNARPGIDDSFDGEIIVPIAD